MPAYRRCMWAEQFNRRGSRMAAVPERLSEDGCYAVACLRVTFGPLGGMAGSWAVCERHLGVLVERYYRRNRDLAASVSWIDRDPGQARVLARITPKPIARKDAA